MGQHESTQFAALPFSDLGAQRRRLGAKIDRAILRVVERGDFIMGLEVEELEAQLAAFCGAREAITCSNGTDALALVLLALEVKPGDAILCPSFTFAATAEVIAWFGATPLFVDVHPNTFNIDAASLEAGILTAHQLGLNPVGVIPVDLFGQPADYDALLPIAEAYRLWLLCDAAQLFGAEYAGRKVGTIGLATSVSFFPAKPLGCYGDGDAVLTDDMELARTIRSLRVHGQGTDKYDDVRVGINGRLDTIQAAVLPQKLTVVHDEIAARNRIAAGYTEGLSDVVRMPMVLDCCTSVWAQYTLRVDAERRSDLPASLRRQGIPTAVYYPKPRQYQTAYRAYPKATTGLRVSEEIAQEVISLPMHSYLDQQSQDRVIEAVRDSIAR